MDKEIIFYAPLGESLPSDKIGGMELGCRKTIDVLQRAGFRVVSLKKPVRKASVISYAICIFVTWLKLLKLLATHRNAVLHVAGCYRELVYVEWLFVSTAKLLRHKTVYEIRNGGMIEEYERRGQLYKSCMLSLIRRSDSVLCQGVDYVHFIDEKLGKSSLYYPNYIQDTFMKGYPKRNVVRCRLVYFGRIAPEKNVDVMLDICRILHGRGMALTLDLIGGYSETYRRMLDDKIRKSALADGCVRFWGRKDIETFLPYLRTCHFFLFPSQEPREGHSNSLTEAMGCGIVPVVSDAGFNRHVVDDDRLVIKKTEAVRYADVISDIWTCGEWESYSQRMYSRVAEHFTASCVSETLLAAYR